jgi:hypothetical protein
MLPKKLLFAVASLLLTLSSAAPAQKLQNLLHQPPNGAGIGFLMTDGTAIFQGNSQSDWWKLTPDNLGSYVKGTWSQIASLPSGYVPLYFASAVLADGRLVIVGGEYNSFNFVLTNKAAIYDPKNNTWTSLGHPKGWGYIGDSPSVVLPDGKFMVGKKLDKSAAVLDPATLQWTVVTTAGKKDFDAEEGWTLMPDGSILTYDVKSRSPLGEVHRIDGVGHGGQHYRGLAFLLIREVVSLILVAVITLRGKWVRAYFSPTGQFLPQARLRTTAPVRDTQLCIIRGRNRLTLANGRLAQTSRIMTTQAIHLLPC